MSQQLSLGLRLRDESTFANFYSKNNEHIIVALQEMLAGTGESFIYLWGVSGSGRTHLLHAICTAAQEAHQQAVYLPLKDFSQWHPDIFDGLEASSNIVCIDDVDSISGNAEWEQALFHFYNRARQAKTILLISGNTAAAQLAIKLPDLRSRLSWGLCFMVASLDDEEKLAALQLRAHARGLKLNESVGRFLLNRYARDTVALFAVLEELDSQALVAQRALTIPFVKTVLDL